MSLALPTEINGFAGPGYDRRCDEMLPIFSRTTRKETETVSKAERAARIERYRRDIEADRPIRFIPCSVTLTRARRALEVDHGPTA